MKRIITTSILSMGLLAALAITPSLRAEKVKCTESLKNLALIHAAYNDLASADHDYDGARGKALEALHKFAREHGIELPKGAEKKPKSKGEKNGKETQAASDAKLDDAEAKLRQVGGKGIEPVIKEIKHALSKN